MEIYNLFRPEFDVIQRRIVGQGSSHGRGFVLTRCEGMGTPRVWTGRAAARGATLRVAPRGRIPALRGRCLSFT